MRRLAERCGYTAPTIYHYFADKKGLFDTLLEERFRRMVDTMRRVRRSDDPVETLLAVGQACVRFGLRNPSQVQLLTALRPDPTDPPQSSVEGRELIEAPARGSSRSRDGCGCATPRKPSSACGSPCTA